MIFSILTPTRNRPEKCERFIQSIKKTTREHGRVELLFYIDNDDPSMGEYRKIEEVYTTNFLRIKMLEGPAKSVSKSWNDIAAISNGDYLIMGNDDLVYASDGWDNKLEGHLSKLDDPYYMCWVNDNINGNKHCAFPIISREWYETVDYFAPGVFHFGYNDTWVFDIAKRISRHKYFSDILVEHRHFSHHPSERDDTTDRNRTQEKGNLYKKDLVIFNQTQSIRQRDAEKIQHAIKEFHAKKLSANKIEYDNEHRYLWLNDVKQEWQGSQHKLKENPTQEQERKLKHLYSSIEKNAMNYPILVAEDMRVLRGNQRYWYAKDHGYSCISAYVIKDADIDKWIQRTYIDEENW